MAFRTLAPRLRGALSLSVACALLTASAAYAAPSTTTSSTAPATSPRKSDAVELDVNVDPKTEQFRKELAEKQKRLDEFKAQLDTLDRELEIASEQYNVAADKLEEVKQKVVVAEGDLDQARKAFTFQSELLGDRASSIYRDGSMAAVDILLDSKSVGDFVARVKFLNAIGIADADIAASLKGQKEQLEKQVVDLQTARTQAESLEFELKARQIEVMLRIQERQQMLSAAQTDLIKLLDAEAARRQTEESALLAEILSGASKKGIVVQPGSPVETALAYHGVPYLWGGESPSGFDCSGLILYVFAQHGVTLPHYSGSQFRLGTKVSPAELAPGDVVFFGSPIHHVGMYIGGGYYLHAPKTGDFVKISKLADRNDYAGARRYDWKYRVGPPRNPQSTTAEALD